MALLLDEVVDLSVTEGAGLQTMRQPVDLVALTRHFAEQNEPTSGRQRISVETSCLKSSPPVRQVGMDWHRLRGRARRTQPRELVDGAPPAVEAAASGRPILDAGTWLSIRPVLLVVAGLLAAVGIDWLFVPWSYPVGAAYGIALLLAAQFLSPRAVMVTTCVALLLSVTSNNLQGAPVAAWLADNASLLLLGMLSWLLARQRKVARDARRASEAAPASIQLAFDAARAFAGADTARGRARALV